MGKLTYFDSDSEPDPDEAKHIWQSIDEDPSPVQSSPDQKKAELKDSAKQVKANKWNDDRPRTSRFESRKVRKFAEWSYTPQPGSVTQSDPTKPLVKRTPEQRQAYANLAYKRLGLTVDAQRPVSDTSEVGMLRSNTMYDTDATERINNEEKEKARKAKKAAKKARKETERIKDEEEKKAALKKDEKAAKKARKETERINDEEEQKAAFMKYEKANKKARKVARRELRVKEAAELVCHDQPKVAEEPKVTEEPKARKPQESLLDYCMN